MPYTNTLVYYNYYISKWGTPLNKGHGRCPQGAPYSEVSLYTKALTNSISSSHQVLMYQKNTLLHVHPTKATEVCSVPVKGIKILYGRHYTSRYQNMIYTWCRYTFKWQRWAWVSKQTGAEGPTHQFFTDVSNGLQRGFLHCLCVGGARHVAQEVGDDLWPLAGRQLCRRNVGHTLGGKQLNEVWIGWKEFMQWTYNRRVNWGEKVNRPTVVRISVNRNTRKNEHPVLSFGPSVDFLAQTLNAEIHG